MKRKCIAYTRAEQIKYIYPIGNISFDTLESNRPTIQHYKLFWKEQLYTCYISKKISMKRSVRFHKSENTLG